MDIFVVTIYIYYYNIIDSTLSTIRVLYNFKSSSNNTIYKYYIIATRVNRSRSIGITRSISKRHYKYKEEQKRDKLKGKLYSNNKGREEPFYPALRARAREREHHITKSV